uniref:Strictosidine synthase conserved region domain-containing protein n=1 Tax=Ditylenchus dipsaci TaxID=166011 RepID=A0A915DB39_9BILA
MTMGSILIAISISFLAVSILLSSNDFNPVEFTLPPPPELSGPLKPKVISQDSTNLFEGQAPGPESLLVEKGLLYTCLADGRCVKINLKTGKFEKTVRLTSHTNCNGKPSTLDYCGRPLGLRRLNENLFVVADSYLGIYSIDFEKEKSQVIIPSDTKVNGKRIKFADDFDILDNDTIIFSDASTKYNQNWFILSFLEHDKSGRIIQASISTGKCHVLVDDLAFPNGVQVHPDKQSVLFSESGTAKIHRYYLAGPKKGKKEIFADNLPGLPDNIRLSSSGKSMYLALFALRMAGQPSFFDSTSQYPWIRKIVGELMKVLPAPLVSRAFSATNPLYGIFLELDLDGNIVNSYHDPEGKIIHSTTQVVDDGEKHLYLGSFENNYIGRVPKH